MSREIFKKSHKIAEPCNGKAKTTASTMQSRRADPRDFSDILRAAQNRIAIRAIRGKIALAKRIRVRRKAAYTNSFAVYKIPPLSRGDFVNLARPMRFERTTPSVGG